VTAAVKTAFKIEVPKSVRKHFWEEPPEGNWEFWAFRNRPNALSGEKIVFTFDAAPVAAAVVHHVEEPGKTKCENTGKFEKHFKIYWEPQTFRRLDGKTASFSDEQLRKASLQAGLVLYGAPASNHYPETMQYAAKYGIKPGPPKGTGLLWSSKVEHITADQYAGIPLPVAAKAEKGTAIPYTDEIGKQMNQVVEKDLPRTKIKISKPVQVLRQGSSSIARNTYSATIMTLPAGTYTLQHQSQGEAVVPISEIEQAGMETLPAVDYWRNDYYFGRN